MKAPTLMLRRTVPPRVKQMVPPRMKQMRQLPRRKGRKKHPRGRAVAWGGEGGEELNKYNIKPKIGVFVEA